MNSAKHQKHKKSKSKKKEKSSSSESGSESETMEWVEAKPMEPKIEHDEWMDDESFVPTYSKSSMLRKSRKQLEKEEKVVHEKKILEQRELNPYWKNGSGLPDESREASEKSSAPMVGDGGYKWLKKAYQRVKEQAQEEGRTMEDVAAERWGSLEKLETKLAEASKCVPGHSKRSSSPDYRDYKKIYQRRDNEYESNSYKSRDSYHSHRYYSDRNERADQYNDRTEGQDRYNDRTERHSRYSDSQTSSRSGSNARRFKAPNEDDDSSSRKPVSSSFGSSLPSQPSWMKKEFIKGHQDEEKLCSENTAKLKKPGIHGSSEIQESSSHKTKASGEASEDTSSKKEQKESSSEDDECINEMKEDPILNQNELNYLAARVLRAKITGDFELASRIERDLNIAKERKKDLEQSGERIEDGPAREIVLRHKVDKFPLPRSFRSCQLWARRQNKRKIYISAMKTKHYDDNDQSIKSLFEREKDITVKDQLNMYFSAAASSKDALIEGCEDDVSGKLATRMDQIPSQAKDMHKMIHGYKKMDFAMDRCRFCLDKRGLLKHTIVAKGNKVFLCVPPFKSLVEGHCFIVPKTHVCSTLHLDEDEYHELQLYKRGLLEMFRGLGKSFIFLETSFKHNSYPHAYIECIPMPKDLAEMAPLYFKKAIDESEYEWANNKKLINLTNKNVRKSVPKELPYFCVEFGFDGGFAHVIEDEKSFPHYFGKEIVGGMLEIDSHQIVKDKPEDWHQVCDKVLKLVDRWHKYKEYFST